MLIRETERLMFWARAAALKSRSRNRWAGCLLDVSSSVKERGHSVGPLHYLLYHRKKVAVEGEPAWFG